VASNVDRTLAALADPTRREVIDLLRKKPRKASDIADALSMSRPAMSRHLRTLRKDGPRGQGRSRQPTRGFGVTD